jgi:pyrimidine-nucleoside phosphorylase
MIACGTAMEVRTAALISRMEEPLGQMVGNACEVEEALACLEGHGPRELTGLCLEQAAMMVALGHDIDLAAARTRAKEALDSGRARETFERMVVAQGGRLAELPRPSGEVVLRADRDGYVSAIDGLDVARTLVKLGAGRQVASDGIDPRVGLRIEALRGDSVCPGAPLARVFYGEHEPEREHLAALTAAFALTDEPPEPLPTIIEVDGLS